jgi:hypothetical protein
MHRFSRAWAALSGVFALAMGASAWAAEVQPPAATASPRGPQELAPIRLDRTISVPVEGGCQYTATFVGTVSPTDEPPAHAEPATTPPARQAWIPDVRVDAVLSCPRGTIVRSNELSRTAPLPLAEIGHALALRANVTGGSGEQTCSYVPSFVLGPRGIGHPGVDYDCGAAAAIGGGPSGAELEQPRVEPPTAAPSAEPNEAPAAPSEQPTETPSEPPAPEPAPPTP